MLSDKIKLTAKDILEKEFKTAMSGYKPEDVDKYLDILLKTMKPSIKKLKNCNKKICAYESN